MPLFTPLSPPPIIADDLAVAAGISATTLILNTVYLRAFSLQTTTIITNVGYRTGSTATGKTNIGIYTIAGNLVAGSDTGQITNVAANDNKTPYGALITLSPGLYFIALSPSTSTDTYLTRTAITTSLNSSYRVAANALSAGALPSTTGALSATLLEPSSALYVQGGL